MDKRQEKNNPKWIKRLKLKPIKTKKIKSTIKEFKTFALKGNAIDLAVGVIVGSAFTSIVNSLVNDIFLPIVGIFGGDDLTGVVGKIHLNGDNYLNLGNFLGAVVNFLLVALCVFFLVKVIHSIELGAKRLAKIEDEPKKEPRKCPYCISVIDDHATRCPHCTSMLELPVQAPSDDTEK